MKNTLSNQCIALVLALGVSSYACRAQDTFFTDTFNGSTLDGLSIPGGTPTASFTSYDLGSGKNATTSTIGPGLLSCKLASATSSGYWEAQALFTTNAVQLVMPGDYVDLAIVFTNSQNTLLNGNVSPIWIGLYNSGAAPGTINPPVAGALANAGLTTTSGSPYATGNCELWQGYVAQPNSDVGSQILTRPVQNGTGTTSANQELLGNEVSGGTYTNPKGTTLATSASQTFTLPTNSASTVDLRITLDPAGSGNLIISNAVYIGAGAGSTPVFTNSVSTSTILATAFDGMAIGAFNHNGSADPQMDISSITVTGHSSAVTNPPTITSEPGSVAVATNGSCAFTISAQGFDVNYQWYRDGAKLVNGGNISGATSAQLVISPASTADEFSGSLGYYCVVTGAGGFNTNSTTNALIEIASTNLVWAPNNPDDTWDINDPVNGENWQDPHSNQTVFNYGDPVVFNDNGGGGYVNLSDNYLSASSITVSNDATYYIFQGSGSIAGPGSLDYVGSGRLTLDANNTYSGGTLISNVNAYVYLETYAGLGTGPVVLGEAGGQMEIVPSGSASSGIVGDVIVADDFTNLLDTAGSYGAVFLGDLSGTSGKTLTFEPSSSNPGGVTRIRAYGDSTVYDANLNLADSVILFAPYSGSGSQTYNGFISGPGAFMQKGTLTYLNAQNTYSGGTYPATGAIGLGVSSEGPAGAPTSGPLGTGPIILMPDSTTTLTGTGEIFANSNSITIGNPIQYASGTNNLSLEVGGSTNLTLTGPFTLLGNDDIVSNAFTSRTLEVTNTGLTIMTGVISDGGANYGFNLTGSGFLVLSNTETYTGPTTNSGGTLLVDGRIGPGAVVVVSNSFLGGVGTISAPVTIEAGAGIEPGNQTVPGVQGIGTLTISGALTILNGTTNNVTVNQSAGTYDQVSASSITYGGTLFATNIAGALSIGDSFKVFSTSTEMGNFTNVIGSPGAGLAWAFDPTNGTLSVVQGVVIPNVPPTITSFAISGANLNITATNGVNDGTYYLLGTTNLLLPRSQWTAVATNVVTASGATEVFSFIGTNVYSAGKPAQFFTLSSTNN
ncbi:MAG TPA: hypothetical protein VMF08_15115 [Candidatus Sulfotelmatobacter sp.]|nr:hypothetical protein [Candidatus Sulfotelmatobacter sp.]